VEARLDALAQRARDSTLERNTLYDLLLPKVRQFVLVQRWRLAPADVADLEQEAFLAYARPAEEWPGSGSFGR
jgi:hypothetical protein